MFINGMTYEEWLHSHLPLMGAEGEEETETEDDSADDSEENDDEIEFEDDDSDDESDGASQLAAQLAEERQKRVAAEQAVRKAKADARKERQERASKSGDWERVAKEHEATIAELQEQLEEARTEGQSSSYELDQFKREVRVTRLASRLGFRDPADATALLKEDDTADDKTAERALRQLAEAKPYLRDPRKASGLPGGGGGRGGLTAEQLKDMTPDEINARWGSDVQSALSRG